MNKFDGFINALSVIAPLIFTDEAGNSQLTRARIVKVGKGSLAFGLPLEAVSLFAREVAKPYLPYGDTTLYISIIGAFLFMVLIAASVYHGFKNGQEAAIEARKRSEFWAKENVNRSYFNKVK